MRRGLTLVELVLTVALAGLLGIPMGLLLVEHVRLGLQTQDSARATQLARSEMERLDAANDFFAALASGTTPNYQGSPYTMTRTVTCLTTPATTCTSAALTSHGVKQVIVSINKPGSAIPLARLITYRTKHVSFGS